MKLLDQIHERYVHDRRTRVLSEALAPLLPRQARVLDIGCGDGLVSRRIRERRPDLVIEGVDILARPIVHIPLRLFDGAHLPFPDRSFDAALLVDVLHHTADPLRLLREAVRVCAQRLVIKDHTRDGLWAGARLRFMDYVGNVRHGVSIPANYWPEKRWREAFAELNLVVEYWTNHVPLYPGWASWLFGNSLHFIAGLGRRGEGRGGAAGGAG